MIIIEEGLLTEDDILAPLRDASKACRKTIIVGNYDRWIKRLEIKNQNGVSVETRLGLHHERNYFGGSHSRKDGKRLIYNTGKEKD